MDALKENKLYTQNEVFQILHAMLERENFKKEDLLKELQVKEFFCISCAKKSYGYFDDLPGNYNIGCVNPDCCYFLCNNCVNTKTDGTKRGALLLLHNVNWDFVVPKNILIVNSEDIINHIDDLAVCCSQECTNVMINLPN